LFGNGVFYCTQSDGKGINSNAPEPGALPIPDGID
jgi:hypothetical protein